MTWRICRKPTGPSHLPAQAPIPAATEPVSSKHAEPQKEPYKAALWGAAISGTLAILAAGVSCGTLSRQLDENKSAAETAYTREIGTAPNTEYVGVLIDAEALYARALTAITAGVSAGQADQYIADIDAMIMQIKSAKAPVDLVATGELREMADLTVNLYGKNGGDLQQELRGIKTSGAFDQPKDRTLFQASYEERLKCAAEAGRITFTETAQKFLGLRDHLPVFTNGCYQEWLDSEHWLQAVR